MMNASSLLSVLRRLDSNASINTNTSTQKKNIRLSTTHKNNIRFTITPHKSNITLTITRIWKQHSTMTYNYTIWKQHSTKIYNYTIWNQHSTKTYNYTQNRNNTKLTTTHYIGIASCITHSCYIKYSSNHPNISVYNVNFPFFIPLCLSTKNTITYLPIA